MEKSIRDCSRRLRNNEIGIFPFDTIWGLVGRIDETVANRLYGIKRRPSSSPLLVVIPDLGWLDTLVLPLTEMQREWVQNSWPGPVTLIFDGKGRQKTLAVRLPKFGPLNELLEGVGQPLYSTSANISGDPFPKRFDDISPEVLAGVDFAYRESEPLLGAESKIVDLTGSIPRVIRK